MEKLSVLVTNDDGIQAAGIRALAQALTEVADVLVVAPDRQRSGTGHGVTVHKPLRVDPVNLGEGIEAYRVNGTPSDCVKLGVQTILDTPPDMVFSGINAGGNLGTDVLYSGTVSGAIEGTLLGIPSAAISLVRGEVQDYSGAAAFAVQLARRIKAYGLPEGTLLNINVPGIDPAAIKGVRVTRLGTRRYRDVFHPRTDPRGKTYYWLAGEVVELDPASDIDSAAVEQGYISITPLRYNLTHDSFRPELEKWEWDHGGGSSGA